MKVLFKNGALLSFSEATSYWQEDDDLVLKHGKHEIARLNTKELAAYWFDNESCEVLR